ncbi:hypothetical protein KC358_g12 [Hortaea werneckii]|nr:hypothetical protein KC358_g12 [Hortaea werneckii]
MRAPSGIERTPSALRASSLPCVRRCVECSHMSCLGFLCCIRAMAVHHFATSFFPAGLILRNLCCICGFRSLYLRPLWRALRQSWHSLGPSAVFVDGHT